MSQEPIRGNIASLALDICHYNRTSKRERPKRLKMMQKMAVEFKSMIEQDDFYSQDVSVELTQTMLELMPIAEALKAAAVLATKADEAMKKQNTLIAQSIKQHAKNRVATATFSQDAGFIVTCVRQAPEAIREEFMNHTIDVLAASAGKSPEQFRAELDNRMT